MIRYAFGWTVQLLRRMPVLIATMVVIGAVLGGAVVPAVQSTLELFDRANPVIVVRARVVSANAKEIVVALSGEKRRECQYIGLQAYTRAVGGQVLTDAYIQRIDIPEVGITRPLGVFLSFGTWRIWPRTGDVVLIYAQHACAGRLVISKVTELVLPAV